MEWSLGVEHEFGSHGQLHAQYVGTRAVNQPYLTQVNGYQTVCDGCFAPFPYAQSTDPRFGAVTQFSTGANSHYNGLQLTAMKRSGPRLAWDRSITPSAVASTLSRTEASCNFPRAEFCRRFREILARDYGPCDYDIRHNLNAQYVYQFPSKVQSRASRLCAQRLAGFGHRFLAQRHSVLRPQHALFGQRQRHRATAAARNSQASFPACRSTNTIPFPTSRNLGRCSGSIPTRSSPP